jgi:hypothetical protein
MKTNYFLLLAVLVFVACKKKTNKPAPPKAIECFYIYASDTKEPLENALVYLTVRTPENSNPFMNYAFYEGYTNNSGIWCPPAIPNENFEEVVISKEGFVSQKFGGHPGGGVFLVPNGYVRYHISHESPSIISFKLQNYFYRYGGKFDTTFTSSYAPGTKKVEWIVSGSGYEKTITVVSRDTCEVEIKY